MQSVKANDDKWEKMGLLCNESRPLMSIMLRSRFGLILFCIFTVHGVVSFPANIVKDERQKCTGNKNLPAGYRTPAACAHPQPLSFPAWTRKHWFATFQMCCLPLVRHPDIMLAVADSRGHRGRQPDLVLLSGVHT